jgi:hypothetical protein
MVSRKNVAVKPCPSPTPRDREIIAAVSKHGGMSRAQIQRVHFRYEDRLASTQAACRRLRLLAQRGYLARVRLAVAQGSGPFVYLPGKRAASVLGGEERSGSWDKRGRQAIAGESLEHTLEIVDFYIAMREALERNGGLIVTWWGEADARYVFAWQSRKLLLSPDAYCLWALGREEGAFFLEWDRGTENLARLAEKLLRYEAYYQLRAYRDHLGETGLRPRLVFVAPDERRRRQMLGWLDRRLAAGELASLPTILVGVRDSVLSDILGPVWRAPGREAQLRLTD